MPRNEYQEQLYRLREDILEMSDVVCQRLRRALEAYETGDEATAERIVAGDHEINERYLELEGDCIGLFALQQPVAGDLRFIASSFKIITDLERIGDLAVNLAQYAIDAAESAVERDRYPDVDVTALGKRTIRLVEDAMNAYATDDMTATHEIAARDDEIDEQCARASRSVVRDLVASDGEADDAALEAVSRTLLTIRDLERVGDHAVNVAARTLYMIDNDDELIY
ncbi:phosphate signaling complex protein PhoU [Natrarchaeobaculum sulfurireducens]|uniref:Phosphate-specific transport system accessory protein PhoU n=1 Tax=Natrarchaeobaculum sulfurireducens TaxID=2044521 RepID=A0A346PAP9_9EURY|nr:phosphate signaling complex protein PhoU [Natrarchaeobaculum sulfurireducens]AXR76594.1 Phosphate uptake regulator [Natrarchaeobaculum sulfurireducens]AXR80271.1 Phosphate transport system regulatory protein PhoU [Natrarchaeobaculum sulfurireducens]